MAARTAVANGNWSSPSTWDGGTTIPTAGDTVSAVTFTVTIDQNISVASLTATTGKFVVSSVTGTRTIAANITGGTAALAYGLEITATSGTVAITGDITGGSNATAYGVHVNGTGVTVTVTGNVLGGASTYGLVASTASTITVTGNATSGSQVGGILSRTTAKTITINGNVLGNASPGLWLSSGDTATVNGNVTGGTNGVFSSGIVNDTAGATITITGTCTAQAGAAVACNVANYVLDCQGTLVPSTTVPAIIAGALIGVIRVVGPLNHASNNTAPISAYRWMIHASTSVTYNARDDSNSPLGGTVVALSNTPSGIPSQANVRFGTTYGIGGALTGTLRVPAASSVAAGVLVDAGVGTAALTPAAVWDALISSLTTSGSIGERLKNAATVATTGDQIAGALDA